MFQGYFDESGVHADSAMFVLAGYVAPRKEWERFVPKWNSVLKKYELNVFHASHCNANKGEFKSFEGQRERRNEFVAELLALISDRPRILAFHSGVAVKEFSRDMLVHISPTKTGHPYYVAMKSLMSMIALVLKERGYPERERVDLVFDRHAELSAYAVDLFNRSLRDEWTHKNRFSTITFAAKDETIPLQAADAFAYDSCREMERVYYHPKRKQRRSYPVLAKNLAFQTHIWNQAEIRRFKKMTFDVVSRVLGTTDPKRIWEAVRLPESDLFS